MPRRIEDFRGLTQPSRVKLLHEVQRIPGQKLGDLALAAGIHINTARDHLRVLEDEGLIVSRPIATGVRGRPPVVFDPVQQRGVNRHADLRAVESQTNSALMRRIYPALDRGSNLPDDAQRQIDTLYTHLEDVGLKPDLDDDSLGITVAPCAYYDLIDGEKSAVCSVHARLIQDQLSQVPGPLRMIKLRPFVTPHECRVLLEAGGSRDSARDDSAEELRDEGASGE